MSTILFVDDDPLTLETLKKSVELFGHQALLAGSGEQALSLAASQSPDLILTDVKLPDIDGFTLVKKLKQNPEIASIPVIVLSASPEADAGEISVAAGAEEFLEKPIRLDKLQSLIDHYTGD